MVQINQSLLLSMDDDASEKPFSYGNLLATNMRSVMLECETFHNDSNWITLPYRYSNMEKQHLLQL